MEAVKEYKCPCCGGALSFNADTQHVSCPYCGADFDAEALKNLDADMGEEFVEEEPDEVDKEMMSDEETKGYSVYHCEACGGEIMADENTAATSCPYCGSPVLIRSRLTGALRPDYILPFKIKKEECEGKLKDYFKGKLFLVPSFRKEETLTEVKPLYAPFWIYDAEVTGLATYKMTRVRKWSDSEYNYTETKYYSAVREGNIAFDHLPVDASAKLNDAMMESIEPFKFEDVVEYNGAYMAGYYAEKYDVQKDDTKARANKRFADGTSQAFQITVKGYDTVKADTTKIKYNKQDTHYAMYPIYLLNAKWREKNFQFAINADTGKIAGDLPLSKLIYAIVYAIITLIGAGLGVLAAFLIFNPKEDLEFFLFTIGIGLIIGAIVAFVFCRWQAKKLKGINFASGASNYYRDGSMKIYRSHDQFLYSRVSRTRRSSSSSSRSHSRHH